MFTVVRIWQVELARIPADEARHHGIAEDGRGVALAEGEGAAQARRLDQDARADTGHAEGRLRPTATRPPRTSRGVTQVAVREVRPDLGPDVRHHRPADLDPASAGEFAARIDACTTR